MKAPKSPPPTHDENEVLRRMLHTPPTHHKPKPAPAKKTKKRALESRK
jgi:hypothetical protein